MDKRKPYRVNGYVFLYDPDDPLLPKNAEPVDEPKKKAAPKPNTKAVKPENK